MYLKTVTLEGYRSAAHGERLAIDRLGQFNIFIGPNNSGKSTLCRFIQVVASLVKDRPGLPIRLPWERVDASWWWQSDTSKPITALLTFAGPAPKHEIEQGTLGRFEQSNELRISASITAVATTECVVLITPHVFINEQWLPMVRLKRQGSAEYENLNRNGQYVSSPASDACPYHLAGVEILSAWAKAVRFYDPVRAIDQSAGRRELADGSDFLQRLRDQQLDQKQAHAFEQFRRRLIKELNALLFDPIAANPIESFEIKGTEEKLDLYVRRHGDEAPIALQYMGTGIAELAIILADIFQSDGVRHYFIEEPECHLHPGLLRRLVARLRGMPDAQFFITTHSSAILDATASNDAVYRFSFAPHHGTTVARCSDITDHHGVLDALGVSGSTLLQTNCAIWVEGPSDRIYLRLWLERKAAEKQVQLVEGSDYSFVFYGGKLLSHFAFADDGPDQLVALLRVCRFSAVVMDRDVDPSSPEAELRATKLRVHDEAAKDAVHRLAVLTSGREIENDIDPVVFKRSLAKVLPIALESLEGLTLSGADRYPSEVCKHVGWTGEDATRKRRKLSDKVGLAEAVATEWDAAANVPAYVDSLLELVLRSRAF